MKWQRNGWKGAKCTDLPYPLAAARYCKRVFVDGEAGVEAGYRHWQQLGTVSRGCAGTRGGGIKHIRLPYPLAAAGAVILPLIFPRSSIPASSLAPPLTITHLPQDPPPPAPHPSHPCL